MRKDKKMNTETKDAMEALGVKQPGAQENGSTDNGGIDYKARCAKLEHELEIVRVEEGRVSKLNEELKARDARIAELEKERAIGSLPENLKEVPTELKETALLLSKGIVDKAVQRQNERIAELERQQREAQENREKRQQELMEDFFAKLNADYPAFMKGIKAGGAFSAAWNEYQENNSESINAAVNSCNVNKMVYHIKRFCEENDVDPSGGRDPNATPDPRAMGGGAPNSEPGTKKTYTAAEYQELTEKARRLREEYRFDEYRKLARELDDAWSEGRVKS